MKRYKKVWKPCWRCKGEEPKPDVEYEIVADDCNMCRGMGGKYGKEQVMRCWGGPLSGKSMTEKEAGNDYVRFNPSINHKNFPCVLIHTDVLEADDEA